MTAANFNIVLNEGLAPTAIAPDLLKELPQYAPHLVHYLDQCQSQRVSTAVEQTRCTAIEYWQVTQAGFQPHTVSANAALALWLATQHPQPVSLASSPFWLVELVHIAPSREGATLLPASALQMSADQSQALLNSALELCIDTDFSLSPWSTTHWQLHSKIPLPATFASSRLVSRTSVNDWWDQHPDTRPWRQFVNELQMLYFDHPVNTQRQQNGQLPINSLWPVGGLSPTQWQAHPLNLQTFDQLSAPYMAQDWGAWLQAWTVIDAQLAPLLSNKPAIVLCNTTDILSASPKKARFWSKFISTPPSWRNHWLAQS